MWILGALFSVITELLNRSSRELISFKDKGFEEGSLHQAGGSFEDTNTTSLSESAEDDKDDHAETMFIF